LLGSQDPQNRLITLRPVVTFRVDANAANLSDVRDFVVSRQGTVAIRQPQDGQVAFVTSTGSVTVFGRRGGGPGEFRNTHRTGWLGDTLWVADNGLRRVTLIRPQQQLGRLISYPLNISSLGKQLIGNDAHYSLSGVRAVYSDGTLLLQLTPQDFNASAVGVSPERFDLLMVRVDTAGVVRDQIARVSGQRHCIVAYKGNGFTGSVPIPYCRVDVPEDVSPDGGLIATVSDIHVDDKRGTYRITLIAASGDTLFSRQHNYAPIVIPRATADSALRARLASANPEQLVAVRSMALPPSFPPLRRLIVGTDSTVWLERWTVGPEHQFVVLNSLGVATAIASSGANQRLVVPSTREAWLLEDNEAGEQSIVKVRLDSPGA
jgi:hypothetical protein